MKSEAIAESRSSDAGSAAPQTGEVQVWRIELGSDGRREARAALGRILAATLGEAGPPALTEGENGKPRLAVDPGRLSFNLSHSGGLALVALAPGGIDVGVDVERIKERRDLARLAARWLPAADALAIAAAPSAERPALFYSAWTRHEARVKCTGVGLAGQPPGREVTAFGVPIDDGYAAALAIRDGSTVPPAPRLVMREWGR
ncbi:MAG TPA: 4'-phosphopantetheinyl transferase superfamily protein [Solirubrobacterales bacterium]